MGNIWDAVIITPFINVLMFIYSLVGNFGIAIILFTIVIRLITHPLTVQQMKGTTAMQELQKDKRWIEAQAKYKNDREKMAQVQMQLYKELGVNPFASCLPTIIQFPILIGLYQAVITANASSPLEMLSLTRHIYPSFLSISNLLPLNSHFLWMDMGRPDQIIIPGLPFPIPILAIIVVITTYLQSKLMAPPSTGDQSSSMMMNMMNIYMPFLMGYLALTLASGLALYFVASNLIGIGQYALLGKLNWSNLLPKRKPTGPAGAKATPSSSKPSPAAALDKPKAETTKPAMSTKTGPASLKATKTVKATRSGVSKPTKMNPKPNK